MANSDIFFIFENNKPDHSHRLMHAKVSDCGCINKTVISMSGIFTFRIIALLLLQRESILAVIDLTKYIIISPMQTRKKYCDFTEKILRNY